MAFESDYNNALGDFFLKNTASSVKNDNAQIAIAKIQQYKANSFIQFLSSRRFYTIILVYIVAVGYSLFEFDLYMACAVLVGLAPFFVPLIIAKFVYPLHHFKKFLRTNNIEEAIHNDSGAMEVAISAYNMLPKKKTLAYIEQLNKDAAYVIQEQTRTE